MKLWDKYSNCDRSVSAAELGKERSHFIDYGGLMMDVVKRQRLEAMGWRVGDAADFLELSPEEVAFIEMKLSLSRRLRELRLSQKISQQSLAKRINTSQSRVAKMEAGDPSVSLDLIVRTLLAMGATREDVAIALVQRNEVIASSQS